MTKREAARQTHQDDTLCALGFTRGEAEALRRISMRLQRWYELECGTGDGQVSVSVERDGDDGDGKPFKRVQYPTAHGYVDRRYPIADYEKGSERRLKAIINARNDRQLMNGEPIDVTNPPMLRYYLQTDPRGAALYIIRPGDVPEGADVHSCYSRGICVY